MPGSSVQCALFRITSSSNWRGPVLGSTELGPHQRQWIPSTTSPNLLRYKRLAPEVPHDMHIFASSFLGLLGVHLLCSIVQDSRWRSRRLEARKEPTTRAIIGHREDVSVEMRMYCTIHHCGGQHEVGRPVKPLRCTSGLLVSVIDHQPHRDGVCLLAYNTATTSAGLLHLNNLLITDNHHPHPFLK